MGTLTIRQVNELTHTRLRERAAANGRSVEAEVRAILDHAVGPPGENILLGLHDAFAGNGVELEIPERMDHARPIDLS
ncbi:plasmid stability protein [Kineosphaera limosa]|uniref:Antitoxin FitA-like ribbon-helix-helix domain-containing protein n=1 Tax=Kineosphaera limosa NBRC 100340 TaxID=1184609 RepID=K6VK05_9MICO|nr:hypothetical protein [Kineosphaera limosa]NYE01241.1 plasmid stability protein [Kineosphaera limosa]GAB96558.1 hypothetical protein KILIM_042_00020 [Kineosphaera limosa NBRC 100340]